MTGRRLSAGEVEKIRGLRADGVEARQIAEQFGVHRDTVYRLWRLPGLPAGVVREHGSAKGYKQHRSAGEVPCSRCRAANTDAAGPRAQARYTALVRLANEFPGKYRAYYAEEKRARGLS